MAAGTKKIFSGVVEGLIDEAVLRRIAGYIGASTGVVYGKIGKDYIKKRINGYNKAAMATSWVVLVDLNHEAECAPILKRSWLPNPAPCMCFRVAVREIESWLMADRERLAAFFSIPVSRIPEKPEDVDDPKKMMVDLAAKSRRKDIQSDIVPRSGSGRSMGPAYNARLIEYASDPNAGWRPAIAAKYSGSLDSCIQGLKKVLGL